MRRASLLLLVALVPLVLAVGTTQLAGAAEAEYTGSDPFSNVAPTTNVEGEDALVNRHPIGHYSIDNDAEVTITNLGDIVGATGHAIATLIWELTYMMLNLVISLFTWAFSLDLLNGEGGDGALGPVADVVHSIYESTFGREWMIAAIVCAGMWGMWKALVQRRYSESAGALGLSVVFLVIALAFVTQPEQTVGRVSSWTNDMSMAFLSVGNSGDTADPETDKQELADRLFESLIYDPWVVLEFGGMSHCVDGEDKPVSCSENPTKEINHKFNQGGVGGYAEAVLAHPPRSKERDEVLQGIGKGEAAKAGNEDTGAKAPIGKIGAADKPAIDIQLAALGFQRAGMAALILIGSLGAAALLGALSLAVILAQMIALLLLIFAPIALVVGIFPGYGHQLFKSWLAKIATALVAKAMYSLILAAVLTVASALMAATGKLQWLLAYGLVAAFYWAVFLYRRQIAAQLLRVTTMQETKRERPATPSRPEGSGRERMRTPTVERAQQLGRRLTGQESNGAGAAGGAGAKIDGAKGALGRTADRELDQQGRGDRLGKEAEKSRKREKRILGANPLRGSGGDERLQELKDQAPTGEAKEALNEGNQRLRKGGVRKRMGLSPHTGAERREARRNLGDQVRSAQQNGHAGPRASSGLGRHLGAGAAGAGGGAAAGAGRRGPRPPRGPGPAGAPASVGRPSAGSPAGGAARRPESGQEKLAEEDARFAKGAPEPPKRRLNLDEIDSGAPAPKRPSAPKRPDRPRTSWWRFTR